VLYLHPSECLNILVMHLFVSCKVMKVESEYTPCIVQIDFLKLLPQNNSIGLQGVRNC
jgi:hypothetical protein